MMDDAAFNDWYDGLEGFALRAERAVHETGATNAQRLREWLRAAFLEGVKSMEIDQ